MTEQHPLTDDIIWGMWSEGDRSALAEEKLARAAADWQLEQDAEQLAIILYRIRLLQPIAIDSIVEEFKSTMRPKQQENN